MPMTTPEQRRALQERIYRERKPPTLRQFAQDLELIERPRVTPRTKPTVRTLRAMERSEVQDLSVPELVDVLTSRLRRTNGGDFMTDRQRANLILALAMYR